MGIDEDGSSGRLDEVTQTTTMFTEKLSSSTSSFARGPAQLLPGSRSHSQHSRAADSQLRENAGSPAPPIAPSTSSSGSSKVHTSPSKVRHRLRSFHSR